MKHNNIKLHEQIKDARQHGQCKYLIFKLDEVEYAVSVLKIREILSYSTPNYIPQTPAYIKGVIKYRDQVVPVIDLRSRLNIEIAEASDESCIIIVEIVYADKEYLAGMIVDGVSDVLDIPDQKIESTDKIGSDIDHDFIYGINKTNDSVRILLNIDEVFTGTNISNL